jgi:tetratricopeptide (TPR) repeat protein
MTHEEREALLQDAASAVKQQVRAALRGEGTPEGEPPMSPEGMASLAALTIRLAAEDDQAAALCDEILVGPPAWWAQRLRQRGGTATAGLVRQLLERTRRWLESSPASAEAITAMAVSVAESLDPGEYPPPAVAIVYGQALRDHAYVVSFQGRHAEALELVARAGQVFGTAPVTMYERARLDLVKALILRNLDRAEEAAALARAAGEVFLRMGDRPRFVNARIIEGAVVYAAGAVERALAIWRSLEEDPALDEIGAIRLAHNVGLCLADLGQHDAAIPYLYRCVVQLELFGMTTERLRSQAVLGRSLVAAGKPREAIPILRETSRAFAELGMLVETATVSLELIEALLATNQPDAVPAICREVIAQFTRAGMATRATAALSYLREASALGEAAPKLVQKAGAALRRLAAEL